MPISLPHAGRVADVREVVDEDGHGDARQQINCWAMGRRFPERFEVQSESWANMLCRLKSSAGQRNYSVAQRLKGFQEVVSAPCHCKLGMTKYSTSILNFIV